MQPSNALDPLISTTAPMALPSGPPPALAQMAFPAVQAAPPRVRPQAESPLGPAFRSTCRVCIAHPHFASPLIGTGVISYKETRPHELWLMLIELWEGPPHRLSFVGELNFALAGDTHQWYFFKDDNSDQVSGGTQYQGYVQSCELILGCCFECRCFARSFNLHWTRPHQPQRTRHRSRFA